MKFGIGQSIKRKEDDKFLTGSGCYNDDINFKDQAYMYIVRSPYAFAKIININFEIEKSKYFINVNMLDNNDPFGKKSHHRKRAGFLHSVHEMIPIKMEMSLKISEEKRKKFQRSILRAKKPGVFPLAHPS